MTWEIILKHLGVLVIAIFKFLGAPAAGRFAYGDDWVQTFIVVLIGGMIGVTFFYYSAGYFMEKAAEKRRKSGKVKKKFTRLNKTVVKIKQKLGVYGIALLSPSFFSIPVGSIIAAKFYKHNKSTIFIMYGGVFVIDVVVTVITYAF